MITFAEPIMAALLGMSIINGTNWPGVAILFAALAYTLSIITKFRPIKALRADLVEKDREIADRDRKIIEKDAKIADFTLKLAAETARAQQLESSRDFSVAFADAFAGYEKRAEDRAAHHEAHEREAWKEITGTLARIAQAVEAKAA